jgi:hypothetical protein
MKMEITMSVSGQLDVSDLYAEVYAKNEKGVMYVKVHFPSAGMYWNSITVRQSAKYPDKGLWVQMPAIFFGKWKQVIEFRNDSPLRDLIHDAVLRAVDQYQHESVELTDEEIMSAAGDLFPDVKPP